MIPPHFRRWFCFNKRRITSPPEVQTISILLTPTKCDGTFRFISFVSWIKRRRTAAWNRSAIVKVEMRNPTIQDMLLKDNHFQERYGSCLVSRVVLCLEGVWKGLYLVSDTSMLKLILMHNRNPKTTDGKDQVFAVASETEHCFNAFNKKLFSILTAGMLDQLPVSPSQPLKSLHRQIGWDKIKIETKVLI